jgi:hypothetical protein
MAIQPLRLSDALTQVGTPGIKRSGANVYEEFLVELQGRTGRAKYREMTQNDATVMRGLRAIKWTLLKPAWTATGGEGPDAEKAREFLLSNMTDMSHTWAEGMREALSCLDYGWSYCQML